MANSLWIGAVLKSDALHEMLLCLLPGGKSVKMVRWMGGVRDDVHVYD